MLTPEQIKEAGELLDREASEEDNDAEASDEQTVEDGDLELTSEQIAELVKKGEYLSKDEVTEIVKKRLAQERRQADVKAEKEKEEAEAQSLKDKEEFRELYDKAQKKLEHKDTELEAANQRYQGVLKSQALEKAFGSEGAKDQYTPFLLKNVNLDAVEVDENGKVTGAERQVKILKSELPDLFAATDPAPDAPAPKRPVPPSPRPVTDEQDQASRDRNAKETISRTYQNTF